MNDVLMNCPKCNFQQPVDTYCASCGVDMTSVRKKSSAIFKQPVAIASLAIVAIIVTVAGVRSARNSAKTDSQTMTELASEGAAQRAARRDAKNQAHLSAQASNGVRQNLADAQAYDSAESADAQQVTDPANSADLATAAETSTGTANPALAAVTTTGARVAGAPAATDSAASGLAPASGAAAASTAGLAVTFAWAEVSQVWLQSMGASEAGLHAVPDLETRLREAAGAYRIVEVNKHRLPDTQPIQMSRGDRINVRFDAQTATEAGLTATVQSSARTADQPPRAPATATFSVEKGQGSIMSFGAAGVVNAAGAPPAGAPITGGPATASGTALVVLILPRWDAKRNP